jgi:hypothetical protein
MEDEKNIAMDGMLFRLNYLPCNELTNVDNRCGNIVDKNRCHRLDFRTPPNYLRLPISQKMVLRCAVKTVHHSEIIENACIFAK